MDGKLHLQPSETELGGQLGEVCTTTAHAVPCLWLENFSFQGCQSIPFQEHYVHLKKLILTEKDVIAYTEVTEKVIPLSVMLM